MMERLERAVKDDFLKHNFILFCGSMVVAVFNYLYHPVLGRMMSVEEFGEVQALVSLFLQFGIIGGVFRIMIINIVSNSTDQEAKQSVAALYQVATRLILGISLVIIALSPLLKQFFQFQSVWPFVIMGVILFTGIPIAFSEATLQGRHRFKEISTSQSIASVGKLLFAVALVALGLSSSGAVLGIILAQGLAVAYLTTRTGGLLRLERGSLQIGEKIRHNLRYASLVLVVSLATSFLFSFDVLVVKHYFSAETAGLYGGISIIARIVFFVTGSIVGVMLPSLKLKDEAGSNRKVLKKSLLLITLIGGTVSVLFALFPAMVINLMLGSRYLAYAGFLPMLSLTLFLVAIINLLLSYMLALRNYRAAGISAVGLFLVIILSLVHHADIRSIIENSLLTTLAMLALMLYNLRFERSAREGGDYQRDEPRSVPRHVDFLAIHQS